MGAAIFNSNKAAENVISLIHVSCLFWGIGEAASQELTFHTIIGGNTEASARYLYSNTNILHFGYGPLIDVIKDIY